MRRFCGYALALLASVTASQVSWAQPPTQPPAEQPLQNQQVPTGAAQNKDFALWLSHGVTDNLGEQSVPQKGSYDNLGLLFNINHQAPRSTVGMATNIEYRHYSIDTFADEPVGTMDLLALIHAVSERFSWSFQDDFGQAVTDPFHPNTVGNRETFNIFATGPHLSLPLGKRSRLGLSSVYSDRRYENSTSLNSTDLLNELGLYRQSSETTELGLIARNSEVEYDLGLPGYSENSAVFHYSKTLAEGNVLAEAGENVLQMGDVKTDGPLLRVEWDRKISARSRITLAGNREFTDSGQLYTLGVGRIDGDHITDVVLSANPLEQARISFRYRLALDRTEVSVQLAAFKEEYQGNPSFDNDSTDVQISLHRAITPRLRMVVDVGTLDRHFVTIDEDDHDKLLGIQFVREMGEHFEFAGRYEGRRHTGSDPFTRNAFEVRITYRPGRQP